MTISIPILTGTDPIIGHPSPCLPPASSTECQILAQSDPSICAPSIQALYASGAICPNGVRVDLYSDDFTGTPDGNTLPDPPWQKFSAVSGLAITEAANTISSNKVIQAVCDGGGGVTVSSSFFNLYDAGYTNFNTTPCGVFTEAIVDNYNDGAGSGKLLPGLCIGVADAVTTNKIVWAFRAATGINAGLYLTNNWATGTTDLGVNGAALTPVAGDKCRLVLSHTGAFTWKLEAFINDISVGSTTNALIQLTNTAPKSIGFWFAGNRQAFLTGINKVSLRSWKGGVF